MKQIKDLEEKLTLLARVFDGIRLREIIAATGAPETECKQALKILQEN